MALLIPILALSIPIIAIISGTYAKTHRDAGSVQNKKILELEEKINSLEKDNLQMEEAIRLLEDKQNFLTKFLEEKN